MAAAQVAQVTQAPQSTVAHAAGYALDPAARYYHLICLVHLAGTGKVTDPIRPEYVPAATGADPSRKGILAWSFRITSNNMAIVHLVASNRHAFDPVFADTRPEVLVFEIGKDSRAAIEAAMQKFAPGFDLSKFSVVAQ
jgi:hypothetical protein